MATVVTDRVDPSTQETTPLLSLRGVTKTYGAIVSVRNVDLDIFPGEVVGLIGDNGAGKSTVVAMMSGVTKPTEGHIEVGGKQVRFGSAADAREYGVETVFQNLALVDCMSVWRNFFMGRELKKGPFMDTGRMREEAVKGLTAMGLANLRSINASVRGLSGGERQALSMGRAVYFERKVLILDEPTSALSSVETDRVFGYVRSAKEAGLGVVVILHNLDQCMKVADRFVVMRHGEKVLDTPNTGQTEEVLKQAMV
jgi:simple sugar transport system ATP-binding protein